MGSILGVRGGWKFLSTLFSVITRAGALTIVATIAKTHIIRVGEVFLHP